MATVIAGSALVAWLLGAAGLVRALHTRAWRIEAADLAPQRQRALLYRLVGSAVSVTGAYALLGLSLVVAISVTVGPHWVSVLIVVIGVLVCVLPTLATVRVTRRALARVSDAALRTHGRRSVLALAVGAAVAVGAGVVVGTLVFPSDSAADVIGMLVVYLLVLAVLQVLVAPLVIVSLGATPLPDETRRRLRRLAARMDVRLRDIRVIPTRIRPTANAAQVGAVPGLRYVLVTEDLLERLTADEVDAVVAHELGHIRGHHLTLKLGAVFGAWAALESVFVVVNALTSLSSTIVLLVPVVLASPLGLLVVQATIGVGLERRADDTAARAVGGGTLADALEAIERVNGPTRSQPLWAAITQHPGHLERVARLRRRVPANTEPRLAPAG